VLATAPDNANSHANKGWSLLEKGQPREALVHFSESLRLDADNEWARVGMIEALKARYFIYRWMLKYFLWMGKLSQQYQWAVVIGLYLLFRVLSNLAKTNPQLAPFVTPLLILYALFVLMSWLSRPLFSLLLRCNRFGRAVLLPEQVAESNLVGGTLLVAVVSLIVALATDSDVAIILAIVAGVWSIPASAIYECTSGWPRRWMALVAAGIGLVGLAAVVGTHQQWTAAGSLLGAFVLCGLLSSFAANVLMQMQVRH
jgi:hypothetical protein